MSKEHAYAYEAGYRDGSINYELEHCPACKNVADLQEALAENDKLQEQIQDAEHEESIAWDRVRSAERRNDELRKLLVDFRNAMWSGGEWTEPFDERMRELGVEV